MDKQMNFVLMIARAYVVHLHTGGHFNRSRVELSLHLCMAQLSIPECSSAPYTLLYREVHGKNRINNDTIGSSA